jgi:hypothetical protein
MSSDIATQIHNKIWFFAQGHNAIRKNVKIVIESRVNIQIYRQIRSQLFNDLPS